MKEQLTALWAKVVENKAVAMRVAGAVAGAVIGAVVAGVIADAQEDLLEEEITMMIEDEAEETEE